jgi:hypothetical protein
MYNDLQRRNKSNHDGAYNIHDGAWNLPPTILLLAHNLSKMMGKVISFFLSFITFMCLPPSLLSPTLLFHPFYLPSTSKCFSPYRSYRALWSTPNMKTGWYLHEDASTNPSLIITSKFPMHGILFFIPAPWFGGDF